MNLLDNAKWTRVSNAVAAGITDVNSSSVNMAGFRSVVFEIVFGTITAGAVTSVKAQQSSDDTTFNDLENTSITIVDTGDDKIYLLEVIQPSDQYVRCVVDRSTQNAVIDSITAIQFGATDLPAVHDSATVGGSESHLAPAEGTA